MFLLCTWRVVKVYMQCLIKAKIAKWHMNFAEKQARCVNLWASVKCDLQPKLYLTWVCFLSFFKNHKISLILCMQKERFEAFPFIQVTGVFFLNLVCETGSRPPPCHPTFAYHKIFNNLLIHWMSVPGNSLKFFWLTEILSNKMIDLLIECLLD